MTTRVSTQCVISALVVGVVALVTVLLAWRRAHAPPSVVTYDQDVASSVSSMSFVSLPYNNVMQNYETMSVPAWDGMPNEIAMDYTRLPSQRALYAQLARSYVDAYAPLHAVKDPKALMRRARNQLYDRTALGGIEKRDWSYVRSGLYGSVYMVHMGHLEDTSAPGVRLVVKCMDGGNSPLEHMCSYNVIKDVTVVSNWMMHTMLSSLATELVLRRVTPSLVVHVASYVHSDGRFYTAMEPMDAALRNGEFFQSHLGRAIQSEDVDQILFQVCHALVAMYNEYRMQHLDIHMGNILLQAVPLQERNECWEYTSGDRVYHVPNRGFIAKLTDWDIGCVQRVSSNHRHVLDAMQDPVASMRHMIRKMGKKEYAQQSPCWATLRTSLLRDTHWTPTTLFDATFHEMYTPVSGIHIRSPFMTL